MYLALVLESCLQCVEALHAQQHAHCDLKPENFVLVRITVWVMKIPVFLSAAIALLRLRSVQCDHDDMTSSTMYCIIYLSYVL